MFRPVSFLAIAFLLGTPAYAQDKTSEIDKILRFHRDKAGKVHGARLQQPGCPQHHVHPTERELKRVEKS